MLAALRDSLTAARQPSRVVDLGCGTGDLTADRVVVAAAEIVAVDQSLDMTLLTEASALAAGHRNVRTITADVGDELGIEPGSVGLVVASCIANNMLIDIAGSCTRGDADMVGYASWYTPGTAAPCPFSSRPGACCGLAGSWSPWSRTITSSRSSPGPGCSPGPASPLSPS